MAAPKKTLYHSELVRLGPVEVEIKTDVLPSQYRGQNDYVIMILDGYDRNYSCENDDCADALKGLQGQIVIIEATGSKEDAQVIVSEATGGGGQQERRPEPRRQERQPAGRQERSNGTRQESRAQERQPDSRRDERPASEPAPRQERQPAKQPATKTPEDVAKAEAWAVHGFKQGLGRFINAEIMIHQAAVIAETEIKERTGKVLSEAAFQAMTSSAWIYLKDTGKLQALPSRLLPRASKEAPKPSQAPQRQQSDPAHQPDGKHDAPQPGPEMPPPDDDVPF